MVSYRYLGSALTNANGVATFDYQGTGAGKIDVIASLDKPITDGSIVSETLSVLDTLMYDTGTDATHNIWTGDTSNLSRGNEYSTLREAEEGTTTRIVTQLPKGLWFLNMQVKRDGSAGNFNFEVIHNNATIFGWATPNGDTWADLKIVYDGEYISCFINDSSTPARKERVYIDEIKNTYFRLQTPQSITYVDFKDLYVFREGASSISIGSSTPIIQTGDTATINGSLYESGLPVQNATLDVYKNGTKVDTVNTGSTGVASYTYSGTGAGKSEFQFKYGSITSEVYSIYDCTFYDDGMTGNLPSKWITGSATVTRNATGTQFTMGENWANIYLDKEGTGSSSYDWTGNGIIEFTVLDISTSANIFLNVKNSNNVGLNAYNLSEISLSANDVVRVENDGTNILLKVNGTQKTSVTAPSDAYSIMFTSAPNSKLKYKEFKYYPI